MPDAVLAPFAARVCLAAVAVTEARVDAQPDPMPGLASAELLEHVGGAGVDRDVVRDHALERGFVEDVRGVDQRRGLAGARIARPQRAVDLAGGDGVDEHALGAHQTQAVHAAPGLLRVPDHVEAAQALDPLADGRGVVGVERRAVLAPHPLDQGAVRELHGGGNRSTGGRLGTHERPHASPLHRSCNPRRDRAHRDGRGSRPVAARQPRARVPGRDVRTVVRQRRLRARGDRRRGRRPAAPPVLLPRLRVDGQRAGARAGDPPDRAGRPTSPRSNWSGSTTTCAIARGRRRSWRAAAATTGSTWVPEA